MDTLNQTTTKMSDVNRVVNEQEAAETLGLSVATLRSWRHRKTGPPFVRFGRAVRYIRSDLDSFVNASRIDTQPGSGPDMASGGTGS